MKKSLLALAVAALAATSIASTASATTVYDKDGTSLAVYGRVQSVFYSDKASGVSNEESSINTSGRLGFDLRSQLNPSVASFAKAEFEMSNGNNVEDGKYGKDSDNFMARLLWVGFDFGKAGQLKFGKFEPAIKYAISQTDIFDDWGCAGLAGNDDRREGVVNYQWSGYGVDVIASYVFAKDNEHVDGAYFAGENVDMKNTVSFAVGYTSPDVVFGPIAVRAGYEMGNFADSDNQNNLYLKNPEPSVNAPDQFYTGLSYDQYNQFAVGLSWGSLNQGPYIAALYQQRKFDLVDKNTTDTFSIEDYTVKGYEFAAGYNFGNGLLARIGYSNQTLDWGDDDVKASTVQAYVNYNFNPQVQVWAEARFDAGTDDERVTIEDVDKGNINNFAYLAGGNYAENVFSAGVRYNF